ADKPGASIGGQNPVKEICLDNVKDAGVLECVASHQWAGIDHQRSERLAHDRMAYGRGLYYQKRVREEQMIVAVIKARAQGAPQEPGPQFSLEAHRRVIANLNV